MINANFIEKPDAYTNPDAITRGINYIFRLDPKYHFIYGAYPPTTEGIVNTFETLRIRFAEQTSPHKIKHFYITFKDCKDIAFINYFSSQVAALFTLYYPVCFALHDDETHLHTHFIVSTTSYLPNTPPLIDEQWKSFKKKVFQLAFQNHVNLQGIFKNV